MVIDKSITLKFYKRKEIQEAIIEHARDREVGVRYGDGFGKRPDVLSYPRDILELAIQGMTSLHASEERWNNPLSLHSNITKKEMDELRIAWDLVLDIDCPDWEISKLTAYLFIKALRENGVKDISCKFSGNKGFHIGVPFESFPQQVEGKLTTYLFPDAPKKIALYLLDQISKKYITIKDDKIVFDEKYDFELQDLKDKFGEKEFLVNHCLKCKRKIVLAEEEINEFICPNCDNQVKEDKDFVKCGKCNILMQKIENRGTKCSCGSNEYKSTFDPLSIIEIDTVLISSRHLYRMPYSLHEKSGLASLPIDPDKVLEFKKEMAQPAKILTPMFAFLDRNVTGESARNLLVRALDHEVKTEEVETERKYEDIQLESPLTEEYFPPCVKLILKGMNDGKKRAVFILTNFLGKLGWDKKAIEEHIMIWNQEKNPEPLRENYIRGQLAHFTAGAKLPPNCDNEAYCKGIGVCQPDAFCKRIKNPANYALLKWKIGRRNSMEGGKR